MATEDTKQQRTEADRLTQLPPATVPAPVSAKHRLVYNVSDMHYSGPKFTGLAPKHGVVVEEGEALRMVQDHPMRFVDKSDSYDVDLFKSAYGVHNPFDFANAEAAIGTSQEDGAGKYAKYNRKGLAKAAKAANIEITDEMTDDDIRQLLIEADENAA